MADTQHPAEPLPSEAKRKTIVPTRRERPLPSILVGARAAIPVPHIGGPVVGILAPRQHQRQRVLGHGKECTPGVLHTVTPRMRRVRSMLSMPCPRRDHLQRGRRETALAKRAGRVC